MPLDDSQISAPVSKAVSALGAGAGSSAISVAAAQASFLPTDLAGWMAVAASTAALIYSLTLMGEWWWKKFWRPFLARWTGWLA